MKLEIEEAIFKSPFTKREIARSVGTTESNISNLLSSKRNIAISLLQDVVEFLDDFHLKTKAAEFCFNLKLLPNEKYEEMPQLERFGALKEENERKYLETDRFNEIMSKKSNGWTTEDIQFLDAYDKELGEEAAKEYSYHISLAQTLKERKKENEYSFTNAN